MIYFLCSSGVTSHECLPMIGQAGEVWCTTASVMSCYLIAFGSYITKTENNILCNWLLSNRSTEMLTTIIVIQTDLNCKQWYDTTVQYKILYNHKTIPWIIAPESQVWCAVKVCVHWIMECDVRPSSTRHHTSSLIYMLSNAKSMWPRCDITLAIWKKFLIPHNYCQDSKIYTHGILLLVV